MFEISTIRKEDYAFVKGNKLPRLNWFL
jgi:hypothetical protein